MECSNCNIYKDWFAKVACILVLIGALNCGLVGIGYFIKANLNVLNIILGNWPNIEYIEYIVYILIGVSAIVKIASCKKATI